MPRAGWLVAIVFLGGAARGLAGQDPAVPPPVVEQAPALADEQAPSSPLVEALETPISSPTEAFRPETEITLERQTHVAAGVGFGGPLGAMASLGILRGLGARVRDGEDRVNVVCALPIPHCAQGFTLRADAGTGGGKLSLGLGARARVEEEDFRGTVGAGLRLALAHSWGSPIGTEPGLTYLGPELDLAVMRVSVTLGVLWRVSGQGGASVLFSWGVGFGL